MNFIPKFFFLIIILINITCEKKIHTVVFKNGTEESEMMVPPSGCYKTRFTATENLNCELDLELYMDNNNNFQMIERYPEWMLPWQNRLWWMIISNKYLRLLVPWLMIAALVLSVIGAGQPFVRVMLILQVLCYAAGVSA